MDINSGDTMEDWKENKFLSPCINYTHHFHIHYVLCTNEYLLNTSTSTGCFWLMPEVLKKSRNEEKKKQRSTGSSGEVNGTPSISLEIASIILLYIAFTYEHVPSGVWNEACRDGGW